MTTLGVDDTQKAMTTLGVDDTLVDSAIAALAVPVRERASLADNAGAVWHELTATRRRAALVAVWFAALVAAVLSAINAAVTVQTTLGPATAHCGLDVFVYGYPDSAIAHACRHAEASRTTVFIPAAIVIVVGLLAAAMVAVRVDERLKRAANILGRAPLDTALITLGGLGLIGGVMALRPANVEISASGSLTTARCGIDTYLFGYPDATVQHACNRAFAPHAHVLVGVLVLAAVGAAALVHLVRGFDSRRVLAVGFGMALAVIAVAAVRPVTVSVPDGGAVVTASCGLDSYLAGYPDHVVQGACRSHDATHAAAALGAIALGVVGLGVMVVTREEHDG
jgi:hypothetical protein